MIGLRLNSQLIAIKINLSCADGSFAFMITYDEQYSAYSPGFLLEIENIRRLHGTRSIAWMDSCADQNSPLFTRAWTERRTIETLLVSSGSRRGDFWIGAIPFGHFLRRLLLPKSAKKDSGALSPTRARSRHVFPKQATSSAAGSDEQLHAVGACSKE
jgi:hypothetical protein